MRCRQKEDSRRPRFSDSHRGQLSVPLPLPHAASKHGKEHLSGRTLLLAVALMFGSLTCVVESRDHAFSPSNLSQKPSIRQMDNAGPCEPRSLINASTVGEADVVNRCNCVFASGSFSCMYGVDCLDCLALFLEETIVQAEHMTN